MFVDDIRRAVAAAPRAKLCQLSSTLWKAYAAGAIGEEDTQAIAETLEAKRRPAALPAPRRSIGSRPRAPESLERRRRWVASGWLPPALAANFTAGELAVLAVVASYVARCGDCRLTIGHIAALAGVGRTTVQNAIRQAQGLGFATVEERRLTAFRNDSNVVRIVSREWLAWIGLRTRQRGFKSPNTTSRDSRFLPKTERAEGKGVWQDERGRHRERPTNHEGAAEKGA